MGRGVAPYNMPSTADWLRVILSANVILIGRIERGNEGDKM